jgi:hypothetical protein
MSNGELVRRRPMNCVVPCVITVESPNDSPIPSPSPLLNGETSENSSSSNSSRPGSTDPNAHDRRWDGGGGGDHEKGSNGGCFFPAAPGTNGCEKNTREESDGAVPAVKMETSAEPGVDVPTGGGGGSGSGGGGDAATVAGEPKRRPPLTRGISRNKSDPKILPVILFARLGSREISFFLRSFLTLNPPFLALLCLGFKLLLILRILYFPKTSLPSA